MTNYNKHVYELETLGFTIVENVFSPEIMSQLKEELKIALENDQKMFSQHKGKKPELVVDLSIHDPIFLRALDNDIMQEIFSLMLGDNPILYSYTSTILRPGQVGGVRDMHTDTHKFIPGYVTGIVMTLPLEDFTEANGATLYLPGSQNSNIAPTEEIFSKYSQTTSRKAGDVLFFNPRVYHRAGINSTDKIRYGLTIYATRNFMKQRFDFPRMIPKESLNGLSDRVVNFLGYNATPPESMDQFYSPRVKADSSYK